MLHLDRSRHTLAALGLLAASALSACGSSREVANDRPLCQRCHGGSAGNAAPPTSVSGATATTDVKVGAHQAHLVAGRLRGPIACDECHVVPADMQAHEAGIAAVAAGTAPRVTFGLLADRGAPIAAWSPATGKCSNTYCHGATINHGGSLQEPTWTIVDPVGHGQASCGTCHGYPPSAATTAHPAVTGGCSGCHSSTVNADDFTIKFAAGGTSTHIDGFLTVDDLGTGCASCHGFPPTDAAHTAHTSADVAAYGDLRQTDDVLAAGATRYAFGCGHCHPLDFAEHGRHFSENAGVFVQLTPDAGTAASLRGLNSATATYATGRCSGVYCHSSGQAAPTFVDSPAWFGGAAPGCSGCHANPPRYASGGPGSATANSHLNLLADGTYEWGHYAGLPGVSHDDSKHGGTVLASTAYWYGESAAPITCQTCHFNTTDPSNTGPSAFYYLDTTGDYELSDAGIAYTYACGACHDGTTAPQGAGSVMPYFHVNGARDVDFDRRLDLSTVDPAYPLPAAPNRPTRPYWFTNLPAKPVPSPTLEPLPADATKDGSTWSLSLQSASWNATTKSCGSVACHFKQTSVQWGGEMGGSTTACSACHPM